MKLLRIDKIVLLLVSVCTIAVSCHKDEEETKPSLTGSLETDVPSFAYVNDKITISASGISNPTTGVTYYSLFNSDTLRGQIVEIEIPDSLATYTVITYAECDGYYSSVYTKYLTSVKPGYGNSLTGFVLDDTKSFIDPRDGETYYYKAIGNLYWFTNNLNWAGAGQPYDKANAAGSIFGRLYTWEEATGDVSISTDALGQGPQGACPDGWSVPTNADWEDLAKTLNGGVDAPFVDNWDGLGEKVMIPAQFNGNTMWPYSVNCTPDNKFGWNAIPTGFSMSDFEDFTGMYRYGIWWSSTEYNSNKAQYRYVFYNQSDFPMNFTDKTGMGVSVRCVKLVN